MDATTKKVVLGAVVVALAALAVYGYISSKPSTSSSTTTTELISVHHTIDGTENIYSGEILLPICSSLATSVMVMGPTITIALTSTNIPSCTQKGDARQTFDGSLDLAKGTPHLSAVTLNGEAVPFTVVEGAANANAL